MPTYEYECSKCGEHLERYQTFSEAPLKRHADCGGPLQRVFSPVGIVLKGSGFYKTDSRAASKAKSRASESKSESKSESTADAKSDSKSDSKSESTKVDSKAGSTNGSKRDSSSTSSSKPVKKSA